MLLCIPLSPGLQEAKTDISMATKDDSEVRLSHDLSEGEIKATQKRREKVLMCLKNLGIHCEQNNVPNIVVLGSGGGLRALIALLGTLVELKKNNLLDAVMYLCGVSGSTWCMSLLYEDRKWSENLMSLEKELCKNLSNLSWHITKAKESLAESSKDEHYSLTDFWASCFVYKILQQFDENELADHREASETGINPYPIYAAVDKEALKEKDGNLPETWFEFTPHEVGYTALGAFVSTKHFGSEFENGKLKKKGKKKHICYMQGLWGSALGNMEENLKFIRGSVRDVITVVFKTIQCALTWKWGTTNNFLYNCPYSQPSYLIKTKTISLIDAGLAINSAYPLVLRAQRRTDLIISFDFSSGDPFETIKKTATYCQENNIPFPKIEDQKMDENNPSDCYIFRGDKSCPTVMHFPLFNNMNCSDKIEEYRKRFPTFHMFFPEGDIKDLLEKARLNVSNNIGKILDEIKCLVSSFHPKEF
ncbi:cytosolic phospholipase A2 gamma [Tyto alba]|uniref:cytosolic phospholipase A2 gamma n=1 Tax=Tyto alba TaxID=56313 RepID=UPI001403A5C1|nr:cytosolic phospholipase A2 gamma [Tyto alba]